MEGLSCNCTERAFFYQRSLSKWQAIPVVGPIVVSPIKATLSLIQVIVGFVACIFLAIPSIVCMSDATSKLWCDSCTFTTMSMVALGYSLLNILTLGIAAWRIEVEAGSGY